MPITTKIPSFLDKALLLRQATPFQGWLKGKCDALTKTALEQGVHPQKKPVAPGNLSSAALLSLQEVNKTSQELVGLCFGTLLSSAFAGLDMGEGTGGEIWRSMLVEQYGKLLAESPVGKDLCDAVCAQVARQEERSESKRPSFDTSGKLFKSTV
ncbi:MAG: hypothetical protein LBD66_02830 [Holosporales bacterium]|jgi:hypothetical protein|nr:hypothetical protein [Holosporales bacterium]